MSNGELAGPFFSINLCIVTDWKQQCQYSSSAG